MIMVFAISQFAMNYLSPKKPQTVQDASQTVSYDQNGPATPPPGVNPWHLDPQFVNPAWSIGSTVAVHVYVSQSFGYDMFSSSERKENGMLPSVVWDNLTWGDWSWSRSATFAVDIPEVRSRVLSEMTSLTWHRQYNTTAHSSLTST